MSVTDKQNPEFYRQVARPTQAYIDQASKSLADIAVLAAHNFGASTYSNVIGGSVAVADGFCYGIDSGSGNANIRHWFLNDTGASVTVTGSTNAERLAFARANFRELLA